MKKINIPLISVVRSCSSKIRRRIRTFFGKSSEDSKNPQQPMEEIQISEQLTENLQSLELPQEECQKPDQPAEENQHPERHFKEVWIKVFQDNAKVFNGLYGSVLRLSEGNMKRKDKILREWCKRTHYQWEDQEPDQTAIQCLEPLIQNESAEECIKWMELLKQAMREAGIRWDKTGQKIVLDDQNVLAYMDWNGEELYLGDMIHVMTPAWHQKDKLIEQGKSLLIKIEDGNLMIPEGVVEINNQEFKGNKEIISVTIPESVKKIGYSAFEGCVNLKSVKIPQTVKCVCADAFTGSGIKEPIYNASGDQLIYCPKEAAGEKFTVPTGVRIIGSTAFRNMPKLKEVIFPDGLESICPTAFYKCGLEKIRIPDSVKNISNGAFIHCNQLKEVIWEEEREFFQENLDYFRITGKEIVTPYLFPLPGERYWEKEEFKDLAEKCGKADPTGMEEMANFFHKLSQKNKESEFFRGAERFWYFRAYMYGSEKGKAFLCEWMERHPKQQMPVPYLSKNLSASVNGLCLKALGFLFFEDRDYELDSVDKDGVVLAKSWAGDDGPDEDGYGMEEFYDWWYMDDCLNFLPGTTCFKYCSYLDRRAKKEEFMAAHDQVADMVRRR